MFRRTVPRNANPCFKGVVFTWKDSQVSNRHPVQVVQIMRSSAVSVLCFVAWLRVGYCQAQAAGRKLNCLDCTRISSPEDCHTQMQCSEGEGTFHTNFKTVGHFNALSVHTLQVCMAEQYVTDSGHVFFDLGCKVATTCSGAGYMVSPAEIDARIKSQKRGPATIPILGRKRQGGGKVAHACEECCENDYCNNYLCGGHVTKNLRCVSCHDVFDLGYCDSIESCQPHEVCYVQQTITDQYQLIYNSGCMREVQCQGYVNALQGQGGFLQNPCVKCCNTSFCNVDCPVYKDTTTTAAPTPPPSTVCPAFPLANIPPPKTINNVLVNIGCGDKEEVLFLVDNSKFVSNIEEHWFEIFVRAFADTLRLDPNQTRFAHAYYNAKVTQVINIEKGDNLQYVDARLQSVTDNRGALSAGSDMGKAINSGIKMITGSHERKGAAKYMIILTEDDITDTKAAAAAAKRAKQNNITVVIVGVGNFSAQEESDLKHAVTNPTGQHAFLLNNFDGLRLMLEDVALSKCTTSSQVAPTLPPDPCSGAKAINFLGCGAEEDIILLLDQSGSIHNDDWREIHNFVHKMVDKFNIAPNASRLGMMSFGSSLKELIQLHEIPDKAKLLAQIDSSFNSITPGGDTNTAFALEKSIEWYEHSTRPDAIKVVIIFTDGGSDTKFGTVAGALELHRRNVTVFVIGIGHEVDIKEQLILASDPDVEHMINVKDTNGLLLYLDYLEAIRCRELASRSSTTVSPTTTTSTVSPSSTPTSTAGR